jgi:hypothetical protein
VLGIAVGRCQQQNPLRAMHMKKAKICPGAVEAGSFLGFHHLWLRCANADVAVAGCCAARGSSWPLLKCCLLHLSWKAVFGTWKISVSQDYDSERNAIFKLT